MHLALVTIIVAEYDPAIRFFVDVLGFTLVEDSPSTTICGDRDVSMQNQPSDENDNEMDDNHDRGDREIPTLTLGHADE